MADKKVKKDDKKVEAVKKQLNIAEMEAADLESYLAEMNQNLITTRQSHKSGELVNPRVLGETRKEIARIKTALRALTKESK